MEKKQLRNKSYTVQRKDLSIHHSFQEHLDKIKEKNPELTSNSKAIEFCIDYYIQNNHFIAEILGLKQEFQEIKELVKSLQLQVKKP